MYDDKLKSREGAAEQLGMSVSALAEAELGMTKCMPADKAVLMADRYNAPHLLNYYCLHECPIGRQRPISDEVVGIDRVTLKLLKKLRVDQLDEIKEKLVDIAEDGIISEDEKPDMKAIMEYLDDLSKTISEIQVAGKRALGRLGGEVNDEPERAEEKEEKEGCGPKGWADSTHSRRGGVHINDI